MNPRKKSGFIVKNPKISISGITVGLEGLSSLIKDNTIRQVCIIISPAIGWVLYSSYTKIDKYINYFLGIKTYKSMISAYKKDLLSNDYTEEEKLEFKKQILICKEHINKIKLQNIEAIID